MSHTKNTSTTTLSDWLQGARPHTWPNAFAPVIAGSAAAAATGNFALWGMLLAAIVSWGLIIGVNYANDYSDGVKGTDSPARSGPTRLTASGLAKPEHVKLAAFVSFGVAGIAGIILSALTNPWLILIGILCVAAAWFYTGGKYPYGYMGLGEVSVFIFFGLVAVLGTEYTQSAKVTGTGVLLAIAIGCFSSAVNLANNLRDIPTDRGAGKKTLAVILGEDKTRLLWTILIIIPYVVTVALASDKIGMLAGIATIPLTIGAAQPIVTKKKGKELIPVLGMTGKTMLAWAIIAFAVSLFGYFSAW